MLYNGGEDPSKDAIRLAGSEHEIWYFSLMFCLKYSSKTYWKKNLVNLNVYMIKKIQNWFSSP